MTEMTPRERSEQIRRQSRDYIAALRRGRLQRAGTIAPVPALAPARDKAPSAFHPSSQASARALQARIKPVAAKREDGPSPREEAATIRRTSATALSQLREARRPKQGAAVKTKAGRSGSAPTAGDDAAPMKQPAIKPGSAAAPPAPVPAPDSPAAGAAILHVASDAEATSPRRARAKRQAPSDRPSDAPLATGPTRDIDVISGLGPALKAKLRQSGIATVETLSVQKPERLREVLGPAGRLVNLEALVRAAKAACGDAPSGRALSKPTSPRRNDA